MKSNLLITALLAIGLSSIAGCQPTDQNQQMQPPAPDVSVAQVVSSEVSNWHSFTGRLHAPQTVQLRPRVSGYIDLVTFEEGSIVKAGEPLFLIDNRHYRAEVKKLEAELTQANSNFVLAEKAYKRANSLIGQKAISQQNLDATQAELQGSQARITAVKAALTQARLDLSHTRVVAPIDGKISKADITQGNFVTAGQSVLTSIVSVREIHAYFDADEKTYLEYAKSKTKQGVKPDGDTLIPVVMGLATDQDFPYQGQIDFIDNQVNESTGTIRGRAVFNNEQGVLLPGLFARLQILDGTSYQGILIDEKAIGTDLNNKYVLVVDENNQLEYRPVELGANIKGLRIVKKGLDSGDTIVVNGLQRVRPGMQVSPKQVAMLSHDQQVSLQALQQRINSQNQQVLAQRKVSSSNAIVGG